MILILDPGQLELDAVRAHARACRYCTAARGCNEAHRLYLAYLKAYTREQDDARAT